ncbi:unnamed protein product [Cladocopium goreaui]|uniref:Uncharacterized protein n=1 Tax=Cladocopium goreaui TaxID=2562237 RepID=A0A9P1C3I4_9DINO|nr:unnamed protein product [Cladocopium goreaui]
MGLKVESSTRFRASLGVPNSQRCATGGLPHCKPHRMQIQALRSFFGWLSRRPTAERVPLERLAVDENWWNQSQVVANDPPADKTVVNNECLQALDTIIGGWCSLGCFLSSHFDQISMLQYLFGTETLSNFPFPNVGSECLGIRDQVSPVGFAYKQHRIFGSFSGKKAEKAEKAEKASKVDMTAAGSCAKADVSEEAENQKTQHAILTVLVLFILFNAAWKWS